MSHDPMGQQSRIVGVDLAVVPALLARFVALSSEHNCKINRDG
jgi:hypothetical protein